MAQRGEGPKVHVCEDSQLLGTLLLCNQLQPSFIPAGACSIKQRFLVLPWNLQGAQEKGLWRGEGGSQPAVASVPGSVIEFEPWGLSTILAQLLPPRCLFPRVFV